MFAMAWAVCACGLLVGGASGSPSAKVAASPEEESAWSPERLPDNVRYDAVLWLCAHNAMSNSEEGWHFPNQQGKMESLLDAGVHALMWDVWMQDGKVVLRHGPEWAAVLGNRLLQDALGDLKTWLEARPQAVVTLIFESYVDAEQLAVEFERTGLSSMCYVREEGKSWPTLGEMRRSGKRLVVMTDRPGIAPAWLMPVWKQCVETPWQASAPAELKNTFNRGDKKNDLLIVNHFVTPLTASRGASEQVNALNVLKAREEAVRREMGRNPNFWVLDFAELGDGLRFAAEVNQASVRGAANEKSRALPGKGAAGTKSGGFAG